MLLFVATFRLGINMELVDVIRPIGYNKLMLTFCCNTLILQSVQQYTMSLTNGTFNNKFYYNYQVYYAYTKR